MLIENENEMMYVVHDADCYIEIDAICASKEALERYLEGKRKQMKDSLECDHLLPEVHRVATFSDEEYEISVTSPGSVRYEVKYCELIGFGNTPKDDITKVWVAHCLIPYRDISIHSTKESAENKVATMYDEDNYSCETLNTVEEWEVLH